MQAQGDKLYVRPDAPQTSAGGIILPTPPKKKLIRGIVLSVGDAVPNINPGDYVSFSVGAGHPIKVNNENVLSVLHENLDTWEQGNSND